MKSFYIKLALITCTIIAIVMIVNTERPKKAQAQLGTLGCNVAFNFTQSVPVWDRNTEAQKNVECTWNGIAWQIAHVALQMLTSSVVNWINSGFQGSPSFLTNPDAFFTDTADQITGALIGDLGPLSKTLCTPFSADVRLLLAMGQANSNNNKRYTCTLSQVIRAQQQNAANAQNGTLINQSVGFSRNGATIQDMIDGNILNNSNMLSINGSDVQSLTEGDLSKGELPGWLAMMTESQNSMIGSYYLTQSDLIERVTKKKQDINKDLDRSGGFLSWRKCDEVAVAPGTQAYDELLGQNVTVSGTKKVCRTETPGSVINNGLSKMLGVPADTLNMADSINEIVSALFSQLMTKVLSGGLYSSSQSSSGGTQLNSYIDQLASDPSFHTGYTLLGQQAAGDFNSYLEGATDAIKYRNDTFDLIKAEVVKFQQVRACIAVRAENTAYSNYYRSYFQDQLRLIDNTISTSLTPLYDRAYANITLASSTIDRMHEMQRQLSQASSSDEIVSLNQRFTSELTSPSLIQSIDIQHAKQDYDTMTNKIKQLDSLLTPYRNVCYSVIR